MDYQRLTYEKSDRTAFITLNRPDALNAIDSVLWRELQEAFRDFDLDSEVWVAILAARGRSFCAGADLRQHPPSSSASSRNGHYFLDSPTNWKPVIAAVQGHCYGLGVSLASECDLVVASEDARFCLIETKRGMPPITIFGQLVAWMGSKVATEMLLTGDPLPAERALSLGLVNQVVPSPDDLAAAARRLADRILENPPLAVRTGVQLARSYMFDSQVHRDAELLFRTSGWQESEDYQESMRAFRERRPPMFTGR